MCDPISAGITLAVAGSAAHGLAGQQVAGAQKKDIANMGQSYEAERTKQAGFDATNQATVGDTLANYSRPNFDTTNDANVSKRQTAYVSPLQGMDFSAPSVPTGQSSAVASANAGAAADAKSSSIAQALAKGKLDAYGDTQQALGLHSVDNNSNIALTNRIASGSERAEGVMQGTLQSKMEADKSKGSTLNGLGDILSAAGMIASMGGGGMFGGGAAGALPGNAGFVSPFSKLPSFYA